MKKKSVKVNLAYQMAYEVLILLLPLVTSPYIARVIGAEGLGQYTYSYSVAYYFALFSMLGVSIHGRRSIAQIRNDQEKLNRTFSAILADHVLASLICCAIYIAYVFTLKKDRLFAAIQTTYVLGALFDISWLYFGLEEFKLTVLRSSAIKLLNVACVFLFVKKADDLWKYCVIMATGTLLSQVVLWLPLHRYVRFVRPTAHDMLIHVKPFLILFVPQIAVSLYRYMDKIMLGAIGSNVQLGYYENAEKVVNLPNAIIGAFGEVMMPKMSYLAARRDLRNADRYMSLSMRYVMCLAFALAFGVAGVGQVFAPVFWGASFASAGTLIMGLAITIPFMSFANVIRTQYLLPQSKDLLFNLSLLGGAAINLIVNGLLIPRMGAIGATIGTIAAEALVCIIQVISVRKELPVGVYLKNSIPFAIFGAGMFAVVYGIGNRLGISLKTLLIQIGVGGLIYTFACVIYFWHTKDRMFMNVLHRIKKACK